MGKGDPCEICGGTESNLVDGFYYCAECGTQDTNVRETLVEHTILADGTVAIARSQKFSVKIKDGVRMSDEWYKWHMYNFKLAGLAEQLVQLGAPRSLKMKVLWIWTRYVKMFQNKDQMRQTQMFSQLQDESASEQSEEEEEAAATEDWGGGAGGVRLRRVTRYLLTAVLAVALNHARCGLQLSHLARLVRHRLLAVNDTLRFVPAELRPRDVPGYELYRRPLVACRELPVLMGRLARRLALGPFLAPDVEALLADQLRDLRLPPALARLALALMHRAPIPFRNRHFLKSAAAYYSDRYPDYEAVVLAYVLVALKMCFGLDDDYEARLSGAAERVNDREGRPRAYCGAAEPPEPARRLFSFREWCVHLQFRTQVLCAHYAALASERNLRAADRVFLEHFQDFAPAQRDARGGRKKDAHAVGDELTTDILHGMPAACEAGAMPAAQLRPCMAQRAPHAALAQAVAARMRDPRARRLLSEDFTRYSLDYAYRTFSLPDSDRGDLFAGVGEAGKTFRKGLGDDLVVSRSDPTIVLVRNCENKNWTKTKRPTARHVVTADEDAAEPDAADAADAPDAAEEQKHGEVALETFEEEIEGENIFDDDFLDVTIKEEIKIDYAPENVDETKDNLNSNTDYFGNFDSSFHENAWNDRSEDGNVERRLTFDSDEEGPRFDPTTFDRQETIKTIMAAAYREYIIAPPIRFATLGCVNHDKTRYRRRASDTNKKKPKPGERRRRRGGAAGLLRAYCGLGLAGQLAGQQPGQQAGQQPGQLAEDCAGHDEAAEDASAAAGQDDADAAHVDPSDAGDVELIENDSNKTDDDDDFIGGPMEDPVYKGDVKFDEKTHDSNQLYVKLTGAPEHACGTPEHARGAPDVGSDEDAAKILDEKITGSFPKRVVQKKEKAKICEEEFTPLVDDPDRLTEFNYWFKHYKSDPFRKDSAGATRVKEMEETLPRSFRFVLREGAALLQQPAALIYRCVMDVEARMLALVAARHPPPARAARDVARHGAPAGPTRKGKRARRKAEETVSREADTRRDVGPASKRKKETRDPDKDQKMQRQN